ncbi:MAG TPA: hypothetical protein VHZ95_11510 [Polyangiales bacterium]|nr:hypothetical protein [Polyangiales bacterium]
MRFRAWALFGLIGLLALGGALARQYVVRRQRGRFVYALTAADPALPTLARSQGYEVHELTVGTDARLRGVTRAPRGGDDPFVLFFPGNAEHQLAVTLPILEALRAGGGAGMACWAYRGFDGSTGQPSPDNSPGDARVELDYVRHTFGISNRRLVIVGFSMGSGVALRLGAELAKQGEPPAAVIVLSPYWTLELTPARRFGTLFPTETYVVDDVIADVAFPLLVVAAAHDEALAVDRHAHRLMRALGSHAEYWELPHAGHHDYLADSALLGKIAAWAWPHCR